VLLGPGDDAAVVAAADGRVVATTDVLVDAVHFRRDWSSAYDVGRKAAAQNLADVAAMGGRPTVLLVGLATPADLPLEWVDGLADGLRDECALVGASVAGGDVVRSPVLTLAVTALGTLDGRTPVTRSGARAGDVVVAAGRLGHAAAGLRLLREGATEGPFVEAHRRPAPAYRMGPVLADAGATAMVDVSDGLLADVGHVAQASGVQVDLSLAALRSLGGEGVTDDDLLGGGDDHALVASLPPGAAVPAGAFVVGRVTSGSGVLVDGGAWPGSAGHDHFRE
jgi:thiamine-monophosphate kinase